MPSNRTLEDFLESHLALIVPLNRECALAQWEHAQTGSEAAAARAAELTTSLLTIYANPEEFAELGRLREEGAADPRLARQTDILYRQYQAAQMPVEALRKLVMLETEVAQEYTNFRATVRGEPTPDNAVRGILKDSRDLALREEAWRASKEIGARVGERVLEMIRIRNQVARDQGFPNHYTKAFTLDELDEQRVFRLFDDLIALTDRPWHEWKQAFDRRQSERLGIQPESMRPWHYTDPFFQEAPPGDLDLDSLYAGRNLEAITAAYYAALGLPVEHLYPNCDLYERPGKDQHAFCMDVDREGDVRVLCNVRSNEYWMGTMLHEFGHAVYDYYTDRTLPYLLRGPAHLLLTEAIAEMMGKLSKDPTWLMVYLGASGEQAEAVRRAAAEEMRARHLVATRWIVTLCRFEREAYRDPEQDLNGLWWRTVYQTQGIQPPDGRDAPDWAAKLHIALAPAYYQNYLLGELAASQLVSALRSGPLSEDAPEALVCSAKVGRWLRENLFELGQTLPWEQALRHATDSLLDPRHFAEQLV